MRKNYSLLIALMLSAIGMSGAMVNSIELVGTVRPASKILSMINNGDAEGDNLSNFLVSLDGPNNGDTANDKPEIVDGGVNGSKCFKVTAFDAPTETWHSQFYLKANEVMPKGSKWQLKMSIKADRATTITTSAQGAPRVWKGSMGIEEFGVTTEWKNYTWYGEIGIDEFQSIAFDLSNDNGTPGNAGVSFYFDNIEFGYDLGDGVWEKSDPRYNDAWNLMQAIRDAEAMMVDVATAEAVYYNTESTSEELVNATSKLNELITLKQSLKEALRNAKDAGFDETADFDAVFENIYATADQIKQAIEDLADAYYAWRNGTTAYDAKIEGIYYSFEGTEATVTYGVNKYKGDIVIPAVVTYNETDYSVVSIGSKAFEDCSGLTSITIPNSVTAIAGDAFFGCKGLSSVIIPNSVTTIGGNAFRNCSGLTSITIPQSVTIIGFYAFSGCSGLKAISVEEGNTRFDSRNHCNAIIETSSNTLIAGCKNTTIPNSVTNIGVSAFESCTSLTAITIPNSVTTIRNGAFSGCSGLTSIMIPHSVTSIGYYAFSGCSGLTSITIPNSVTSIGGEAFSYCSGLTSIVVEEGNIKFDSRSNCNAIIETLSNKLIVGCQNTTIPNSVMTIGAQAFISCSGLTSITIPNGVTTIEGAAFAFCSGLTSVTIPNSVTSIGSQTFLGCSGLTSITIPSSVASIGYQTFLGCTGLTDVYCYAENVPTTNSDAFAYLNLGNITLHVRPASIDSYKTTSPWSDFKEIVESDYLNVADLNIKAGESNIQEINLSNGLTNLVGFQMDLALPEGICIDKTGCTLSSRITDESQELTIGKLESGGYRITSTSLSLTPISGNGGTLLSLKLTAEDGNVGGQATISNIIFSTAESEKIIMSDKTFDITVLKKYNLTYKVDGDVYTTEKVAETTPLTPIDEPTKVGYTFSGWSEIPETMPNHDVEITGRFYLYGDVNTDEEVDVVDVVDIARFVVTTPSVKFREKLADLNKDNTVNIADAVTLVNHIAGDQNFARATASSEPFNYDQCQLQLLSTQVNALSLCLDGDADFTAFQFEMELPENTDITAIRINSLRKNGHQLLFAKVAANRYRVAVLSLSNSVFKGNEGELLSISIDGLPTDEISVDNILFVTKNGTGITFNGLSLSGTVTGIANIDANEGNNTIFDLQGRKLSKVQRGINIVNGRKVFVNK